MVRAGACPARPLGAYRPVTSSFATIKDRALGADPGLLVGAEGYPLSRSFICLAMRLVAPLGLIR